MRQKRSTRGTRLASPARQSSFEIESLCPAGKEFNQGKYVRDGACGGHRKDKHPMPRHQPKKPLVKGRSAKAERNEGNYPTFRVPGWWFIITILRFSQPRRAFRDLKVLSITKIRFKADSGSCRTDRRIQNIFYPITCFIFRGKSIYINS
jgi:hypothetical protein